MAWWLLALPALWLFILLLFANPARAAWREPVLRHPVLIIESDDWGPGPSSHAQALERLMACLNQFRDGTGRAPVMTLGLTLALPDSEAIGAADFSNYHPRLITDPAYADILTAVQAGIRAGVFAPQLHGMAHYWPDALMAAARQDLTVRAWVLGGPGQETEVLPSPLQSRWVDASVLPSRPLPEREIESAVSDEVSLYRQVFGAMPIVVVPPTFVWTEVVEAAWTRQGVNALVTPGFRCTGRDSGGQPRCEATPLHNGQTGIGDITYLVRDRYFEPAWGHRAEQGLIALEDKTAQGRPCLLETHRFNFTGNEQADALAELDKLLRQSLARQPGLRFASAADLAEQYRRHGDWVSNGMRPRLAAWAVRMGQVPRFARLARMTGLGLVLSLLGSRAGGAVA